jgi:hypothetical protein
MAVATLYRVATSREDTVMRPPSAVWLNKGLIERQIGFVSVRPEGACHQWRRVPPRELSIDLVANERLARLPGR